MAKNPTTMTPWYKVKYPMSHYLRHGEPELIEGLAEASQFSGWRDIEEVKLDMWEDCKGVVLQKNKKREFRVEAAEPVLLDGEYGMKIKLLHLDYRGFIYVDWAPTKEQLLRQFWPVVEQLVAIFCSPKLKEHVIPVLPPESQEEEIAFLNERIKSFVEGATNIMRAD